MKKGAAYLSLYRLLLGRRYGNYRQRAASDWRDFHGTPCNPAVVEDMCRETVLEGTYFEEYLRFHFEKMNPSQRREYLTDAVRNHICDRVNDADSQRLLLDKYKAWQRFKPHYRREMLLVAGEEDRIPFVGFASQRESVVVKPVSNCAGRGVRLLRCAESWDACFDSLTAEGGRFVVEEPIVQAASQALWHPSSVNTIRANTILYKGRYTLFSTFLRVGRGGSFVDNGGQGGLLACIDPETGIIVTDGCDENGTRYDSHPDTHRPFKGTSVEEWSALKRSVEALAHEIPELAYVAWDMALTPDGWAMVEGNKGQFLVQQLTVGHGIRKEFEALLG